MKKIVEEVGAIEQRGNNELFGMHGEAGEYL